MRGIVNAAMKMVSIEATQRNIELEPDMPKSTLELVMDGQRFKQIIVILLENAIKFSQNTPIKVSVWMDHKRLETSQSSKYNYLHVSVEDQGTGIPESDINRIFNYYFQSRVT